MRLTPRRVGAVLALALLLTVSLVPAASAAPAAGTPVVYWVRHGDTLYGIAARFGVSAEAIAQANGIRNWDYIQAGQRLIIPSGYGPCGWNPCPAPKPSPCGYNPCPPPKPSPCGYNPCPPPPPPPPKPQPKPQPCGWEPCPPVPCFYGPWTAEYYTTNDLSGPEFVTRQEGSINYNWGWGPPLPGMPNQNWSARWSSYPSLSGRYRVQVAADDGVRVWVDDTLVIDEWRVQAVHTFTQDFIVASGHHSIRVEYFQAKGVAELHLWLWKVEY